MGDMDKGMSQKVDKEERKARSGTSHEMYKYALVYSKFRTEFEWRFPQVSSRSRTAVSVGLSSAISKFHWILFYINTFYLRVPLY